MPTARVDFDKATTFGQKLDIMLRLLDGARQYVSAVSQEAAAFAGDTTSFAAKTGIAVGSCQAVLDQIVRMNGELNAVIVVGGDLAAGATSNTKTIVDRMA